jgi:hypothetical protein
VNSEYEKLGWRKYYERLEQLRWAKEQLDRREITQEDFQQLYDEVETLMTELDSENV